MISVKKQDHIHRKSVKASIVWIKREVLKLIGNTSADGIPRLARLAFQVSSGGGRAMGKRARRRGMWNGGFKS